MGFERQELRQIRAELEKAIDTHQQIKMAQNGDLNKYVFNVGNCSYNDSKATFKGKPWSKKVKCKLQKS